MSKYYHYDSLEDIEKHMWLITGDTEAIGVIKSLISEIRKLEQDIGQIESAYWERIFQGG